MTESLRHTSCCVDSLNNSGITVKDWRDTVGSSHSQQTYHGAGMQFEECRPRLWTAVGSERVSTHGRGPFPVHVSPMNAKDKTCLLAGKNPLKTGKKQELYKMFQS